MLFLARKSYKNIPGNKLPVVAVVGLLSTFIPSILFGIAQKHVNSGLAGILNATVPIFTGIISLSVFKNKFNRNMLFGVLLGLFGTFLLIIHKSDGSFSLNTYAVPNLLAAFRYGININLVRILIL